MKKRVFTIVLCLSLILGTVAYAAVDFTGFKMTFSNTNTYQKITSDTTSVDNPEPMTRAGVFCWESGK